MRAKIGPRDFIISIIFGFAQDRGKRSLESIRKSVNLQYKADEYNGQLPSLQRAGILYNVSCTWQEKWHEKYRSPMHCDYIYI